MSKADVIRQRKEGKGALAWLAFLVIAVVGVAALISGAIRHQIDPQAPSDATRSTVDRPSPAPPPLPKGVKPPGRALSMYA